MRDRLRCRPGSHRRLSRGPIVQILIHEKFLVLEFFAVAAIYYLIMTSLWDVIQRRIEAHYGRAYNKIQDAEAR